MLPQKKSLKKLQKTKAIITVDLKGQPVDYDEIYSKLKNLIFQ